MRLDSCVEEKKQEKKGKNVWMKKKLKKEKKIIQGMRNQN